MESTVPRHWGGRIVLLALDTFGDLVLRQPLFSGLLDRGCDVTVVVRSGYESIVPHLDRRLHTIAVDVASHAVPDASTWSVLTEAVARIAERAPDLLVAAAHNRTYADEWILHQFPHCATVGFVNPDLPGSRLDALPSETMWPGTRRDTLFTRPVSCETRAHELDKARALLRAISGEEPGSGAPQIQLGERARVQARAVLDALGLEPRHYVFGCPGGAATVALKEWPAADFATLAVHLHARHRLPVLLAGSIAEAPLLHEVRETAEAYGLRLPVWTGAADDLDVLLGLIAHSRLYLGNDTGPMHMAGALDVPVVARFGGGHWPRFVPLARRSFTATQQLPCFGCGWQCYRDAPACLTRIDMETFVDGIDWTLASDTAARRVEVGRPVTEPWPARLEVTTPPRVLVVTPSFNQGPFLRDTIESVLGQSYPFVEYVVADGGSTDESVAILRRYGDRLRWTSGPDGGQAAAVARAWRQTDADIVGWLNSDDTYLPDAIATAVDHLATHRETAMVYGQAWLTNAAGERLTPYRTRAFDREALAGECFVCQPAAFVRRSALDTVDPPDPTLQYCMDYDLWIRLSAQFRLDYIERFLATSRVHPATKTASQTDVMLREIIGVVRRHFGAVHRNWIGEYARHALAGALGADHATIPDALRARLYAVMEDLARGNVEDFLFDDRWAGRRTVVTVESGTDGRVHLECECSEHLCPLRVQVRHDGQALAETIVRAPGRFVLAFELPPAARPRAQVLLDADRSFIPVVRGLSSDPRTLSFVVIGQTTARGDAADASEAAGTPHRHVPA